MERCLNVLHRGQLIPSLSLSAGGNEELARSWINALYALIRASLDIFGTSKAQYSQRSPGSPMPTELRRADSAASARR
jgi:hypothetical protein